MRDLLTDPLWRPEDLGKPIPDSPHPVSATMPTWDAVIGYEEQDPRVVDALQCGYPRFFCHPTVERLFEEATCCEATGEGECALVFASEAAAERALHYLESRAVASSDGGGRSESGPGLRLGAAGRVRSWEGAGGLIIPRDWRVEALRYWRYTGEIVSSRQAAASLGEVDRSTGLAASMSSDAIAIDQELRSRLAAWAGEAPEDGFLYTTGMAAIFASSRAAEAVRLTGKTIQLEFPYVDVFCIQRVFGEGAHLLLGNGIVENLREKLAGEKIRAVFCEVPCNPLTRTVDLAAVSGLCRTAGVPLIVDDTLGSVHNVDVYPYADLVTTSLTKPSRERAM